MAPAVQPVLKDGHLEASNPVLAIRRKRSRADAMLLHTRANSPTLEGGACRDGCGKNARAVDRDPEAEGTFKVAQVNSSCKFTGDSKPPPDSSSEKHG